MPFSRHLMDHIPRVTPAISTPTPRLTSRHSHAEGGAIYVCVRASIPKLCSVGGSECAHGYTARVLTMERASMRECVDRVQRQVDGVFKELQQLHTCPICHDAVRIPVILAVCGHTCTHITMSERLRATYLCDQFAQSAYDAQ